jgi:hypothetical protein
MFFSCKKYGGADQGQDMDFDNGAEIFIERV